MKTTWMLTSAALRKNKSQTLSLLLIILLSVMLLNVGLVLFIRSGNFFDQRAQELNAAHWTSYVIGVTEDCAAARYAFVRDFPQVIETEALRVLNILGELTVGDTARTGALLIAPYNAAQRMNPPRLLGDGVPLAGDGVYVPYFLTLGAGITVGDAVTFTTGGDTRYFTLAGGTEEMMFGASGYTTWRVYVPAERFDALAADFPEAVITMVSARMENPDDTWRLTTAYFDTFLEEGVSLNITYLSAMRNARTQTPLTAAMLVAAFSLIVLVVGVIVIRFRIINGIEETMVNIGVQKAMGYRSRQIILSIVIQFTCIALAGGLLGVFAAQGILPLIIGLIQPLFGLRWSPLFDLPLMAVSLGAVVPMAALFSFLTALRTRRLHPLTALRGGIATHSFKRNPFALDTARGPLTVLFALKNLYANRKQAVMIGIIVVSVVFTAVGALALHYNFNVNDEAFIRLQLGDTADVWLMPDEAERIPALLHALQQYPEVRRAEAGDSSGVTPRSTTSVIVNGISLNMAVIEDFTQIAPYSLVAGRFPRHENEIAVGANDLARINARIGDWVTITSQDGETTTAKMITGSTQSTNLRGMISIGALTATGSYFAFTSVTVRLTPGTDIDAFIYTMTARHGAMITEAINIQAMIDELLGPMGTIFAAVATAVLTVVAAVIILVLYMVIKTGILRRRKELGIQKALGCTTLQLMNQIALGMIPVVTIGVLLGAVAGYFGFNPVFLLIMRGAGIARANLPVPLLWVTIAGIALTALAYAVSMLVAWRIRRISAYALVTE